MGAPSTAEPGISSLTHDPLYHATVCSSRCQHRALACAHRTGRWSRGRDPTLVSTLSSIKRPARAPHSSTVRACATVIDTSTTDYGIRSAELDRNSFSSCRRPLSIGMKRSQIDTPVNAGFPKYSRYISNRQSVKAGREFAKYAGNCLASKQSANRSDIFRAAESYSCKALSVPFVVRVGESSNEQICPRRDALTELKGTARVHVDFYGCPMVDTIAIHNELVPCYVSLAVQWERRHIGAIAPFPRAESSWHIA